MVLWSIEHHLQSTKNTIILLGGSMLHRFSNIPCKYHGIRSTVMCQVLVLLTKTLKISVN